MSIVGIKLTATGPEASGKTLLLREIQRKLQRDGLTVDEGVAGPKDEHSLFVRASPFNIMSLYAPRVPSAPVAAPPPVARPVPPSPWNPGTFEAFQNHFSRMIECAKRFNEFPNLDEAVVIHRDDLNSLENDVQRLKKFGIK